MCLQFTYDYEKKGGPRCGLKGAEERGIEN